MKQLRGLYAQTFFTFRTILVYGITYNATFPHPRKGEMRLP